MVEGYPRRLRNHCRVDEMNCDELVEKVTDYLDDALGTRDRTRLEEHVHVCRGCQGHLGEVRVTLRVMSSLATELSHELELALLETYRHWADSVSI
jgi:hypothetical protein